MLVTNASEALTVLWDIRRYRQTVSTYFSYVVYLLDLSWEQMLATGLREEVIC